MKIIFENYAGDLTNEEKKIFLKKLKEVKYSHLDFSLRHPFGIGEFRIPGREMLETFAFSKCPNTTVVLTNALILALIVNRNKYRLKNTQNLRVRIVRPE